MPDLAYRDEQAIAALLARPAPPPYVPPSQRARTACGLDGCVVAATINPWGLTA